MITEGEHSYIELKHTLQTKKFNHAFQYLRWIVCWDFDKAVGPGTELAGVGDNDMRTLQSSIDDDAHPIYFLDNKKKCNKIQVVRLKEFLKNKLGLEFECEHG